MKKLLILGAIAYLPLAMTTAHANPPLFIDDGGQYYDYGQRYDDGDQYFGHTGLVPGTYGRTPLSLSTKVAKEKSAKDHVTYDYGSVYDRFISASNSRNDELSTRGSTNSQKRNARMEAVARVEAANRHARELELAERQQESQSTHVDLDIDAVSDSSAVDDRYTERGVYHGGGYRTDSLSDNGDNLQ